MAGARTDIDHVARIGHRKRRERRQRRDVEPLLPFLFRQIKPRRRQRLVRRRHALLERLAAGVVVIGDLREAFMRGVFGQMLERQRRARQIVEQRLHRIVKQRQPVLHAGIAAALAHRFVQQIVRRARAEFGDIAGAEAPDGFGDELEFRHRHQIEPAQLRFADLRLRVEAADRLQRVAEKIETNRHVHAGRIKIENAAAHRVFAGLAHGRGAGEAVKLQPFDDARHADDIAGRDRQRMCCHELARRHALQRGVDGRKQHRRLVAAFDARQPRQRGHALRHHAGIRRHSVVGQAIPGREFHGLNVGAEERKRRVTTPPCAGRRGRSRQAKPPAHRCARR